MMSLYSKRFPSVFLKVNCMISIDSFQEALELIKRNPGMNDFVSSVHNNAQKTSRLPPEVFRVSVLGAREYLCFSSNVLSRPPVFPGLVIDCSIDDSVPLPVSQLIPVCRTTESVEHINSVLLNESDLTVCHPDWVHGCLVSIKGRGILICGFPGSGKSHLVKRILEDGHQMVADDIVECNVDATNRIVGRAVLTQFGNLAVRENEILDVCESYGDQALSQAAYIDLLVSLDNESRHDSISLCGQSLLPHFVDADVSLIALSELLDGLCGVDEMSSVIYSGSGVI